ncbi:hypothetical protein EBS43_11980, partial [bacterium]|nr:hypothetical protein [bacterium]
DPARTKSRRVNESGADEDFIAAMRSVLQHPELDAIKDPYKKAVTALVLENQQQAMRQDAAQMQALRIGKPAHSSKKLDKDEQTDLFE